MALLLAMMPLVAGAQAVDLVVVAVAKGYRTSRLTGRDVVNARNEKIGKIDDFVIGRDDKVLFAILQVRGFLGIGSYLVAAPYRLRPGKPERQDRAQGSHQGRVAEAPRIQLSQVAANVNRCRVLRRETL